jgi:CRISPR-associated endonuclease/helicase Cas3
VHTYDTYTHTIIDSLLKELLELRCTVIILSATLSKARRGFILGQESINESYPLISAKTDSCKELSFKSPESRIVSIKQVPVDDLAMQEAAARAESGQQVIWVENTVEKAQYIFKCLASSGIKAGLLHSRFIKNDRDYIEREWLELYGKDAARRGECGRILVGTQILEQSLDIDADFLITRLAPIDMLFQRIGRLWRHNIPFRCASAKQEMWVLMPNEISYLPKKDFGGSAMIYEPYILYRTFEELSNLAQLNIPTDIRVLIEKVYTYEENFVKLSKFKNDMSEKAEKLKRRAGLSLASFGEAVEENKVSTRYIEVETISVILARHKRFIDNNLELTLLSGKKVLLKKSKGDIKSKGGIALELLKNSVPVPKKSAPHLSEEIGYYLENYLYIKGGDYTFGIVGTSGKLEDCEERFAYDKTVGYQVLKR